MHLLPHRLKKRHCRVSSNSNSKIECCCNKRVPLVSLRGPSPNTSAAAWQGPRHHLKGTTVKKINLASSLPRTERRRKKKKGGRDLFESTAGIPILANCFVGCLPKLWCEQSTLNWGEDRNHILFLLIPSCFTSVWSLLFFHNTNLILAHSSWAVFPPKTKACSLHSNTAVSVSTDTVQQIETTAFSQSLGFQFLTSMTILKQKKKNGR